MSVAWKRLQPLQSHLPSSALRTISRWPGRKSRWPKTRLFVASTEDISRGPTADVDCTEAALETTWGLPWDAVELYDEEPPASPL